MFHACPCGSIKICQENTNSDRQTDMQSEAAGANFFPSERPGLLDILLQVRRHVGSHCVSLKEHVLLPSSLYSFWVPPGAAVSVVCGLHESVDTEAEQGEV